MSNITTLLKYSLKTNAVKTLYFDVISKLSNYYYTFGKSTPWPTVTQIDPDTNVITTVSDEDNPPSVSDVYSYELETRNDIQYLKLINPNDVAIVVPRYDWIVGTIYDQYDEYSTDRLSRTGAIQLADARFYVLTDELNVYKCLFNNKNRPSSVKPTGNSPFAFSTSDGYIWKFMYSIPLALKNKFLISKFMPVVTSLNDQFYGKGAIKSYRINNKGKGYIRNTWRVLRVRVIDGGSGYDVGNTILQFDEAPTGGTRATAVVESVDSIGAITSVRIVNKGAGYRVQPTLKITAAQTGAQGAKFLVEYEKTNANGSTDIILTGDGHNELNPFSIKTISIVDRGSFSEIPSGELFAFPAVGVEHGQLPDVDVTFREKTNQPGVYEINTIIINSGGFGYSVPLVYGENVLSPVLSTGGAVLDFNTSTQKNHAKLIPLISGAGEIVAVQITEQGVGYSFADIQIIGYKKFPGVSQPQPISDIRGETYFVEGFRKADITVDFSVGDADSKQSDVELLAVDGSIEVIAVDEPGTGFNSTSVLTVIGDGIGCTCVPVIGANGELSRVVVTNPGKNYTFANVTVTGGGAGAVIRPIISPKGGHGKDAIEELYANTILFNTRLVNEKNQGSPITNDFRQVCIAKDITAYNSEAFFGSPTGSACALIRLEKNDGNANIFAFLNDDDKLFKSTDQSKFVTIVEKNNTEDFYEILVSLNTNYLPGFSDTLVKFIDESTSLTITLNSVVAPTVDKYSGQLLYIDNRVKFVSNAEQTVTVNTLITL